MSASVERPSNAEETTASLPGGLDSSQTETRPLLVLSALPVGARLILRCRKDWRDATVAAITLEQVTLSVGTSKGRTYRVRRPASSKVFQDGPFLVLGEGSWRAGLVRYDVRW